MNRAQKQRRIYLIPAYSPGTHNHDRVLCFARVRPTDSTVGSATKVLREVWLRGRSGCMGLRVLRESSSPTRCDGLGSAAIRRCSCRSTPTRQGCFRQVIYDCGRGRGLVPGNHSCEVSLPRPVVAIFAPVVTLSNPAGRERHTSPDTALDCTCDRNSVAPLVVRRF